LRSQFDAAVGQLLTVAHRIQTLTSENDKLRREVAVLQEQLAQKAAAQSA
jgi:cell division septum initiation protein DivIVA